MCQGLVLLFDSTSYKQTHCTKLPGNQAASLLLNGTAVIHDAKFSGVKDLGTYQNLESTFTNNQKPAFTAISEGNATVTVKNSTGGKILLGREFSVGKEIKVQPSINIYVNTPEGIKVRKWP